MKAVFVTLWLAILFAQGIYAVRTEGRASVRRAAYVQFYPNGSQAWGPYMGECLTRPDGLYCSQEKD